jgi:hypothetical protein
MGVRDASAGVLLRGWYRHDLRYRRGIAAASPADPEFLLAAGERSSRSCGRHDPGSFGATAHAHGGEAPADAQHPQARRRHTRDPRGPDGPGWRSTSREGGGSARALPAGTAPWDRRLPATAPGPAGRPGFASGDLGASTMARSERVRSESASTFADRQPYGVRAQDGVRAQARSAVYPRGGRRAAASKRRPLLSESRL